MAGASSLRFRSQISIKSGSNKKGYAHHHSRNVCRKTRGTFYSEVLRASWQFGFKCGAGIIGKITVHRFLLKHRAGCTAWGKCRKRNMISSRTSDIVSETRGHTRAETSPSPLDSLKPIQPTRSQGAWRGRPPTLLFKPCQEEHSGEVPLDCFWKIRSDQETEGQSQQIALLCDLTDCRRCISSIRNGEASLHSLGT